MSEKHVFLFYFKLGPMGADKAGGHGIFVCPNRTYLCGTWRYCVDGQNGFCTAQPETDDSSKGPPCFSFWVSILDKSVLLNALFLVENLLVYRM